MRREKAEASVGIEKKENGWIGAVRVEVGRTENGKRSREHGAWKTENGKAECQGREIIESRGSGMENTSISPSIAGSSTGDAGGLYRNLRRRLEEVVYRSEQGIHSAWDSGRRQPPSPATRYKVHPGGFKRIINEE